MVQYRLQRQKGSALLVALMLMVLLSVIGLQMHNDASDELTVAGNSWDATSAFYAAEAGQAIAQSLLWKDYINFSSVSPYKQAGNVGNRQTYHYFLDNMGIYDGQETELASNLDIGYGQRINSVTVRRSDVGALTELVVTSTGTGPDNSAQRISAVYQAEGEAFKGFDFAVLSNNVNCIFCHTTIDNVDRYYNTDDSLRGTFDRVKVASLESMLLRTGSADSHIGGTLYTRGVVMDKSGNIINDLSPSGKGIDGFKFDTTGKIQEPLTTTPLVAAAGNPPPPMENLYLNYPTDESKMVDGVLPSSFPPPFPDLNGNRTVDDNEFLEVAQNATGAVTGGIIYGVKSNQKYTAGTLPGTGNLSSVSGEYDGNLILVGTPSNPIVINDNIAVNGDVVIQGVVKGTGQILARGNVYVTGDISYDDAVVGGKRTFGVAADGTRNALSIAAGNNIMVGDYLATKNLPLTDPNNIDPGNLSNNEKFSFTMSEITLFNRGEWTKTQQFLPDINGNLVPNATYIPGYKPRYYTLNPGDPVYIYNKMDSKGKGTYWDPVTNTWKGKEHVSSYDLTKLTKLDPWSPELIGATISPLSSTNNWISPDVLKSFWNNDEASRATGDEFSIDGQLYTNNSIFTLARKASKTQGKMLVNGALVAADLGILAGNGLQLNYDQRLKNFLKIKDDSKITLTRVAWYSESQ